MINLSGDRQFHKPAGYILMDGQEVGHTMQCCHCGQHFPYKKGSGVLRGYCTICNQITCGLDACNVCVPFEAKLEFLEGTKNRYTPEIMDLLRKGGSLIN